MLNMFLLKISGGRHKLKYLVKNVLRLLMDFTKKYPAL